MKKSAKQLGDQFEKLSQKEMNYGREKVRKGIGLEDLTSKEQEFWNKGTKKMVGRKLSKKLVQKWRERVFKLKGLKRTQENEWSYSTTTPNKMHSCEISKFLGLNREIPKASREWGKQLHKRIKTLILFHSSSGSRKTKEQCFSTLRKRNWHAVSHQLNGVQSRYYPKVQGFKKSPSQISFQSELPKAVLHQNEGVTKNKDTIRSWKQRPSAGETEGTSLVTASRIQGDSWAGIPLQTGDREASRWPLRGSVRGWGEVSGGQLVGEIN